uniref:Adenine DNA glycosylase n=1 Tax=Nothobranchius furzeri TaxID=105023 RepID=A0A8C6MBD3_NOTFU
MAITEGRLIMNGLRSAVSKGKRGRMGTVETSASTRKRSKQAVKEEDTTPPVPQSSFHTFSDPADVVQLRSQLLSWYDKEKRELPEIFMFVLVWVSEIMLQQTQVATVKEYYKRWLKKWPTVQDLAAATIEEVNQMWSGLGYYSRGRRLHEGAQKVVLELKGRMPRTVDDLLKQLPGVGRYTAAAVGSIALGQVTGAVDGNVIRVLCRVRAIGADSTRPTVTEALWNLSNLLVDPERPGDFNQALMELGAQVCTPKGPLCIKCPVQSHCRSYHKEQNTAKLLDRKGSNLPDIEDCINSGACPLCPSEPWNNDLGVQNFPRKPAKKAPRVERTLTCVVTRTREEANEEFLLLQRPNKGLLAGLWEFPSLLLQEENSVEEQKKLLCNEISTTLRTCLSETLIRYVGEVVHIFSHIHQTYVVYSLCLKEQDTQTHTGKTQWLDRSALQEAAVSTGLKKVCFIRCLNVCEFLIMFSRPSFMFTILQILKLFDSADGLEDKNSKVSFYLVFQLD